MIKRCAALFIMLVFVSSCGNKNKIPPGILKPEKMQNVLWDVIRADAFTSEFIKKDSARHEIGENVKLQQQIFSVYHITKEDFYKSYEYYKSNTDLMKEMLDSMITRADRDRNKNIKIQPIPAVK